MTARKVYRTKSGVLVTIEARKKEFSLRYRKPMWKGDAVRVDTGGRHGWLWMHQLKAVTP